MQAKDNTTDESLPVFENTIIDRIEAIPTEEVQFSSFWNLDTVIIKVRDSRRVFNFPYRCSNGRAINVRWKALYSMFLDKCSTCPAPPSQTCSVYHWQAIKPSKDNQRRIPSSWILAFQRTISMHFCACCSLRCKLQTPCSAPPLSYFLQERIPCLAMTSSLVFSALLTNGTTTR